MPEPEPPVLENGERYEGLVLTGQMLAGLQLRDVEFEGCRFERCRLNNAVLHRCRLVDCRFDGCDLSGVRLPSTDLREVRFLRTKLVGVDWTELGASEPARALLSFSFEDCVLDYGNFKGMRLKEITMQGGTARQVELAECDLRGANLRGLDLEGATFQHTNLQGADLRDARHYAIDPTTNRIRGLKLSLPEALALLQPFGVEIAE